MIIVTVSALDKPYGLTYKDGGSPKGCDNVTGHFLGCSVHIRYHVITAMAGVSLNLQLMHNTQLVGCLGSCFSSL